MGQLASGLVTYKESGDGQSAQMSLIWGYSGMQGWRDRMEDAHIAIPCLGAVSSSSSPGWQQTALFGVMDGHGGEQVAQFCQCHLPNELARESPQDAGAALISAFHRMDELLKDPYNLKEFQSFTNDTSTFEPWRASPDTTGCTAVIACIQPRSIVVANAGDSRAVLSRRGKAIDMSSDHKPNLPGEVARIQNAGGVIIEQQIGDHVHYRVNGNLNLSRSIGDLQYKQNSDLSAQEQLIVCHPDVRRFARQPADEFMIIACDGVWDVLSSQEAVDFVRSRIGDISSLHERAGDGSFKLSSLLEEMLDACVFPDQSETMGLGGDNMTAILIVFVDPHAEWANFSDSETVYPESQSWMCSYDT